MDYTTPHSCRHCETIIVSRPEDNPDFYEDSKPRQSLFLYQILLGLRRWVEGIFFLAVDLKDLVQFASDGCEFFKLITSGLSLGEDCGDRKLSLKKKHTVNPRQTPCLVGFTLGKKTVSIGAAYKPKSGNQYREIFKYHHTNEFEIFTQKDSQTAENFESTESVNISSEEAFTRVRGWLQDCVQNHPKCSRPTSQFSPTRLIKIWTHQDKLSIQLKESNEVIGLGGTCQNVRTTKSTLSSHHTTIDFQHLPKAIQDAVIVTEKLGIQYLWVDALCIIQNNEMDKALEIDRMRYVYENAEVTIAVSRAEEVHEGFLQDFQPYGYDSNITPFKIKYLSKRAWAFQERWFSHRYLEYGPHCVHWFCRSRRVCDRRGGRCTVPQLHSYRRTLHLPQDYGTLTIYMWHEFVNELSRGLLTHAEDRLPAMAGVAERFGSLGFGEYLAGIWQPHLIRGLLWVVLSTPENTQGKNPYQRSPSPLAPSWSWASTIHLIVCWSDGDCSFPAADFLKADIKHQVEGATYGRVISGRLTLRGFVARVSWRMPEEGERWWDHGFTQGIRIISAETHWDAVWEEPKKAHFYLLVLVSNRDKSRRAGLVLQKRPDNNYSRLGTFRVPTSAEWPDKDREMAGSFMEGKLEEVTIV
ncbi:HET-domain-containing protein [Xylaria digitata]|nr:HET-domain-containing protein [Xylaria digitata]